MTNSNEKLNWKSSGTDYDMSIHTNPDQYAWADFFLKTFPNCGADRDKMAGWFANVMMAKVDSMSMTNSEAATEQGRQCVCGLDTPVCGQEFMPMPFDRIACGNRRGDDNPGYNCGHSPDCHQPPAEGKEQELDEFTPEFHGCFTGDCPHDHANTCLMEVIERYRALHAAYVARATPPTEAQLRERFEEFCKRPDVAPVGNYSKPALRNVLFEVFKAGAAAKGGNT